MAVLIETLGDAHRLLSGEPELASRFLLQRRGGKRRRGASRVGLGFNAQDCGCDGGLTQHGLQSCCLVFLQKHGIRGELSLLREITAGGNPATIEACERHRELLTGGLVNDCFDVGITRCDERAALEFAINNESKGWRLNTACRLSPTHPPPQHRGHLEPVKAVEDAPGLLRVDQCHIKFPGLFGCFGNALLGDFVKHHALDRDTGFQHFE